jgi:hypothetical protein
MDLKEIEVRNIENIIKRIFNKEVITETDIDIHNLLINKWKKLTNWVEKTENPIKK